MLDAISPLDGRYSTTLKPLREHFSEFALIRERCRIECSWLLALDNHSVFPNLESPERERIIRMYDSFSADDAQAVKEVEKQVKHDVKSLEYFLRERLALQNPNRIHFGLTSEDVNNLAWSSSLRSFVNDCHLPVMKKLLTHLCDAAIRWQDKPFPAHTHGQPASPTTAGKEFAVFISRLLFWVIKLGALRFCGKLNGATGNYSALLAAVPDIDWIEVSRKYVESLGFIFNPVTTQIEGHDSWAEYFNITRQINNVIIDMDQDLWNYIMLELFRQRPVEREVGSSTMPHKINPIRFENAEGNLLFANAMLAFLADKLCRSRMQRDLSDSTVTRNIGVALGHSYLGLVETLEGLSRIELDAGKCLDELNRHPELLAEPVQTSLRMIMKEDPYEILKTATRGKAAGKSFVNNLLGKLDIDSSVKERLSGMKVTDYVGKACEICRQTVDSARKELDL